MSDKNIHGFYPANAISNRPKTSGTPIADVEAFIAKHGVTDLDANPQAKPRKLQFIINGKTCVDLSEQDYSAKKKQAKAEYQAALKNLASGTAELRIKDEPADKPKSIPQLRIENRARRLAEMKAQLLSGEPIKVIDGTKDKTLYWRQRSDIVEFTEKFDIVKSRLFGSNDYIVTLRQNVMTKPVDKTPFTGFGELKRRLLDGQTVLSEAWEDKRDCKQNYITRFVKRYQADLTVIYEITGNRVIGWQIADK